MPADGLPLPVRVGGEIDILAALGRLLQVADNILFSLDRLVVGREILIKINADHALGQIPQVAHAGLHLVVLAQVFSDGLRLRRRLHDHKAFFCHSVLLTVK